MTTIKEMTTGVWIPIGSEHEPFTGNYDGKGFSVSDLYLDRPYEDFMGLFGYTSGATIKELNLLNVSVNGKADAGGLVGRHSDTGLLENCSVEGEVSAETNVGGLAGSIFESAVVNYCHGEVTVNGTGNNVGGLVGRNDNSTIYRSSGNSQVTGNNYVGGLVGFNENSNAVVSESYSKGTVTGDYEVGGLVGRNNNRVEIVNCYSVSDVSGRTRVGGLAGGLSWYTDVTNSYSAGHVSAEESQVGGFAGGSSSSTTANCLWDIQASGQEGSYEGTGLTTAEMNTLATFTNAAWDFKGVGTEEIWNIGNERNNGYPYFDWEFPGDATDDPPSVATLNHSDISETGAVIECEIVNMGNPTAMQHGICWNTSGNPTLDDDITDEGAVSETGIYASTMTGLSAGATYFVRAYAMNDNGVTYGNEIAFSTTLFEVTSYVSPLNSGTVSGTGNYFMGEEVTLEATPEPGYAQFVDWTSDGHIVTDENEDPVGAVYVFTMPEGNVEVTANFELIDYTVSLEVVPENAGTVAGEGNYNMGDEVTASAEAGEGYDFVAWKEGETVVSETTDHNFTIPDGNVALSAQFLLRTYNLTYTSVENGSIEGDANQEVEHGGSGTSVEAVPDENYHFTEWSDGVTDNPRADENVTGNISVTAQFAINTYTLTYIAGENGTLSGELNQVVEHNAYGSYVEAIADEDYHFTGWSDGATDNPRRDLSVTGGVEVTAFFESIVSIKQLKSDKISIYPNPVRDVLYVDNVKTGQPFELRNAKGELMRKGTITDGKIDVNHLASGVYILYINGIVCKIIVN